jgi:hypothetical protein
MRPIASSLTLAAALAATSFVLVTSTGCQTVTGEDRQVASAYLENAAQYYDAGHYLNAYQQWNKALAFDPEDERAQLGQAMALYQLGRDTSKEGMARLAESEKRLDSLRAGGLGDQSWKAELGYALVQQRWAELYDRAVRIQTASSASNTPQNPATLATRRQSFATIALGSLVPQGSTTRGRTELQDDPWLGLANDGAARRDRASAGAASTRSRSSGPVSSGRNSRRRMTRLFGAWPKVELRDVLGNTLFKLGQFGDQRLTAWWRSSREPAPMGTRVLRESRGAWTLRAGLLSLPQLTDLTADDPTCWSREAQAPLQGAHGGRRPHQPRPRTPALTRAGRLPISLLVMPLNGPFSALDRRATRGGTGVPPRVAASPVATSLLRQLVAVALLTMSAGAALADVLELTTGELISGKSQVVDDAGVTFARDSGGSMRVTWDIVVPRCRYDLVKASIAADDAAARVKLAKWALGAGMYRAARRDLLEAKGLGYTGTDDVDALFSSVLRAEARNARSFARRQGDLDSIDRLWSFRA